MIDFSKPISQKSKFTANRSELLVNHDVKYDTRSYDFDNVVFAYVKNGIKKINIPTVPIIDLSPDMVIMGTTKISADVTLETASIAKPTTCFTLEISKNQVWTILDKINESYQIPDLIKEEKSLSSMDFYSGIGNEMIVRTLESLQHLLMQDVQFKDYWIDLKIEELILSCLQTNMRNTLIYSYQKGKFDNNHPLAYAVHYIKENLYSQIEIKTLADKSCMSKATFFRQFKHHFGITPINFIHSERIKEAQKLLRKTNKSISEIGYSLGYTSPSYFTKKFEKTTGTSPKNYRQQKYIN